MSTHIEKALLLFERRPELAAKELLAALVEEPDDSYTHALLGLCLMNAKDKEGAFAQVKEAIRLDPEDAFAFYALAKCHFDVLNMLDAEVAIDEALRLEPWNETYWGLLSNIQIEQGEWKEALKSAESGLEISPADVHCHNLRALIKTKLGQKEEAKQSLDTAMAAAPDDALTHAYRGWALIEHYNHADSISHFREALRLDPTMEWARQGLIKALEVRHWAFQLQLKLGWRGPLAIICCFAALLAFLQTSVSVSPGTATDTLQVIKNGCMIGIIFFLLMLILRRTSLLDPFIRFLLLFDRDGRLVLTREERIFNTHLVAFITAGVIGIACASQFSAWWIVGLIAALYFLTVTLTIPEDKRDKKMWLTMSAMAVLCGVMTFLCTTAYVGWGALRMGLAYGLTKGLITAGGAKAVLGAIGLGATATAMKVKEKQKLREQMLNQQTDSTKKSKKSK